LLEGVLPKARALGTGEIEHVIDDPPIRPQFQHHPQQRIELLESLGFSLRRETSRFERRGGAPPVVPERLSFRALPQVGEDAFVDAIEQVSEGTLDREIRAEIEKLGAESAAREFFDDAQRVEHDPTWWRLAYVPNGDLVGLVMPAEPPGFLTIFYVGVVPEMRGQGYIDELLAAGTATLLDAQSKNTKPLIADTDVANGPMAAAFQRAGWVRFAGRREYVMDLGAGQGNPRPASW
jgi:RimJ/RimL family protein N-acetyltransferase